MLRQVLITAKTYYTWRRTAIEYTAPQSVAVIDISVRSSRLTDSYHLPHRALYRRSEEALYQAARTHFRGRRGELRRMVRRYLKPHRRDRSFLASLVASVTRALFVALLMLQLWATPAQAQPSFSSSSPANATHATAVGNNISATFSEAIAGGTVSASTFVVHGGFTGQHGTGGTASTHRDATLTGGGSTTLTFDPGTDFAPGELVGVTLTTGLQNGSAQALSAARVFQFRAATTGGPAVFSNASHDVDSATDNARATTLGDLDGDGDLDLVVGNYSQVNRVYLNTGTSHFSAGSDVETGTTHKTRSAPLGDLDGDGDLDLVTGNFSAVNRVYLGDGSGSFAAGNDVEATTSKTVTAELGDLDGDGDLDLVTGNNSAVNRVHLGDGSGGFAGGFNVETGATNFTRGMALGDVDGDGDLDLIAANLGVNRMHLGTGSGTFAAGVDLATGGSNSTQSASFGDLDGDGDLDLIVADYGVNRFYLGDGSGSFGASNDVETGTTNNTLGMSLGDLDGDGDLDVIFGTASLSAPNRVHLSMGSGSFAAGSDVDSPTNSTQATALGDLDGDGDLDLVTGNNSAVNRVYLNNNTSFSSSSPTTNANNTTTTANVSATFNQSMNAATSSTFVVHGSMTGQRAGSYSGASSTTLTFDPTNDFEPGEKVDVMLLTGLRSTSGDALQPPKAYRFRAAAAAGPVVFDQVTSDVGTPTNDTYATSLGDLDGDGDLDPVTGNVNQVNRVYLSNGNGTFASGSDVDTPANTTFEIALGDVDGDGDLDLITGNSLAVNRVYLGNGNGTFTSGNDVDTPTNPTRGIELGDVDGDGDPDLLVGNTGVNRRYLSNGDGTFASGSDVDTPNNSTWDVSFGDVDGDGDLDIVTGNAGQANRIYLNEGNSDGTLTASATLDESSAISLIDTIDTQVEAKSLFDFTLTDGGGGGGVATNLSQVVLNTSGTGPFSKISWLLNGPDATNAAGTYSSGANTITFSGLSLSLADGANETYTLSGYYNNTSGLTVGQTFSFSIDGDTDVTVLTSGSEMSGSNAAVSNAAAAQVAIFLNSDGALTASSTLDESSSIGLAFAAQSAATAVDLLDFNLTDGGGGDGLALEVSQIVVNKSGTGTFSGVTWLLNGPDASDVVGAVGASTITFSGLSISVAEASSEVYTVSGYFNDLSTVTLGDTYLLSLDGDTDLTLVSTGSAAATQP